MAKKKAMGRPDPAREALKSTDAQLDEAAEITAEDLAEFGAWARKRGAQLVEAKPVRRKGEDAG